MTKTYILKINTSKGSLKSLKDIISSCNGSIEFMQQGAQNRLNVVASFCNEQYQLFCKYLIERRSDKVVSLEKKYLTGNQQKNNKIKISNRTKHTLEQLNREIRKIIK